MTNFIWLVASYPINPDTPAQHGFETAKLHEKWNGENCEKEMNFTVLICCKMDINGVGKGTDSV